MNVEQQHRAIRRATALSRMDHVACTRLSGEDAFDAIDALCPSDLFVRDGQMLHTLFLRDDGTPLADLYACRDDEDFILLSEGLSAENLTAYIRDHLPRGVRPDIQSLGETHRLFQLNGPFCWELMAELVGPGVVGLPYLTFFHEGDWTCFRAGKTGEYGYDILVRNEDADTLWSQLVELGKPLDLGLVGLETLDQCALENWFFNIRREGLSNVTPIELQLQWRVTYHKDYVGAEALKARRQGSPETRLTCVVSSCPLEVDTPVFLENEKIGRLVNAGFSPTRGDWVGLALLGVRFAHPGTERYTVLSKGHPAPIRTVSPPVLNNLSLFVNPQRHSYRTRHEQVFPPLVLQ